MKKFLIFVMLALFVLPAAQAVAQEAEKEPGHIFIVTTHKVYMPTDGNAEERDAMLKEMFEIDKKNTYIVSQRELRHMWGADNRDWVIITEYKSWADIEAANKMSNELYEKHWPDKEKRDAFFQKLFRYFPKHSDEIYREMPEYRR